MAKYIFVTGGVVSSLGKGIAAATIGCLLESRGLRVTLQKFDPYLNVDPGTMSPFQHGEVFVTDDGAETDLDLGHYERFIDRSLAQANNVTTGRIYLNVITKERCGEYLGSTVQVIPHITDEIKAAIRRVAPENDGDMVEVGGTVGDIESQPFTEPIPQSRHVAGRYTEYADSYKSVLEALIHGGIANDVGVEVNWISIEAFTNRDTANSLLSGYDGLLVPGGFGVRGIEGMVEAIRSARETGLPFLGICLGMQTAIIEFARNVCHLEDSHSSEFEPECDNAVISLMESQQHVTDMGGTMRLGAYPCRLARGSRAAEVYGVPEVSERHRHRYEVSNRYRDLFVQNGMRLSGLSPDGQLVEIIELQAHPWFIGCQFHPELQSRPTRPHPLFAGFIAAAAKASRRREGRAGERSLVEAAD